jgi:hypothetical protein
MASFRPLESEDGDRGGSKPASGHRHRRATTTLSRSDDVSDGDENRPAGFPIARRNSNFIPHLYSDFAATLAGRLSCLTSGSWLRLLSGPG